MNKKLRIIIVIVVALILCYAGFVSIDCIRLQNSKFNTKPLITISEEIEVYDDYRKEYYNKYKGLGYSITYSYYIEESSSENITGINGNGAEFKLFDRIMIWAWIE